MAYSTQHHHNQLLFNLGVSAMPANMAVKFHQPAALVVEKFGPSVTPLSTPIASQPSMPAFQFSAVSQDRLSVALQLAKRDIKQKKLDESLRMQEKKTKKSSKQNLGIQSRYSRDIQKKTPKNVVASKEKANGMGKSRAKAAKSSSKMSSGSARPGSMVLHVKQSNYNNSSLPASGMSPPTRDIDPDPHLVPPNPQDQRSLQEIKHLRGEINKCLDQILKIEETAQNGGVAKRRLPGEDDLPEYEVSRRRAQRSEEQASRSARLVYNIQQQVKDIQHEIDKLRPGTVNPNKKSQLLSRLAAAHRGTIRALQAFVTQLEDHDWTRGLPKTHQELTLLVRQLALCCAQLEVAGQSAVPNSVKNLIKDMAEYNVALEKEFHASPPRCTRPGPSILKQQRSPASRRLYIEHSVVQGEEAAKPPIRKELLKGDTACGGGDSDKENVTGDGFRINKSTKDRPNVTASSPERESVLRQGIAALIRAAESPRNPTKTKVPPLNLPRSQKAPRYSAYDKHVMKRGKRGVIIPVDLRARRDRTGSSLPVYTREGHFAEPTVASKLKEVPPHERPVPGSPRTPRKSSVSPRRGFPSPRVPVSPHIPQRCARSLSPRPPTSPGSPGRYAQREIERQVMLDREASKKMHELELYKRKEMQEIEKLRKELGKPDHWITDAERRIRERLRPLLEKAQEIADRYEEIERKSLPGTQKVRRRTSDDVELNADILSEMIVDDLTQEVAQDLSRLTLDEDVEQEARVMQAAPSLETIIQRLHEMENEQHEIRRRYATISYEDELPGAMRRTAYFDTGGQDRPRTPPQIQVDKTAIARSSSLQELTSDMQSQYRPAEDEGAILFTKPQPQVRNFHLMEKKELPTRKLDQKIQLNLSDEMISNILNNKERYAKFLKRTSTQAVGRFNPWQVVEQVSDEILEECLLDIAKELEDINSEIVNHVYRAEFNEAKSVSSDDGQQTEET